MSHEIVRVETYQARYDCDECKKGGDLVDPQYMKFTGYSRGGTYHHQCPRCGHEQMLEHKYPYIFYQTKQEFNSPWGEIKGGVSYSPDSPQTESPE